MAEQFCVPLEFGRTACVNAKNVVIPCTAVTATNTIIVVLETLNSEETVPAYALTERVAGTSFAIGASGAANFKNTWFLNWIIFSS